MVKNFVLFNVNWPSISLQDRKKSPAVIKIPMVTEWSLKHVAYCCILHHSPSFNKNSRIQNHNSFKNPVWDSESWFLVLCGMGFWSMILCKAFRTSFRIMILGQECWTWFWIMTFFKETTCDSDSWSYGQESCMRWNHVSWPGSWIMTLSEKDWESLFLIKDSDLDSESQFMVNSPVWNCDAWLFDYEYIIRLWIMIHGQESSVRFWIPILGHECSIGLWILILPYEILSWVELSLNILRSCMGEILGG